MCFGNGIHIQSFFFNGTFIRCFHCLWEDLINASVREVSILTCVEILYMNIKNTACAALQQQQQKQQQQQQQLTV
jgi:hypothetical protein